MLGLHFVGSEIYPRYDWTGCQTIPEGPRIEKFNLERQYRVTGNVYITVIIFPGINFGITLHSLYRKHFLPEIILLYIILTATRKSHLFCLHFITLQIPDANEFCNTLHYGYINRERGNRALVIVL